MDPAKCALCKHPVNLLSEHLVTAQFVDARSGTLTTLHFHGACYVKWHALRGGQPTPAAGGTPATTTDPAPAKAAATDGQTGGQTTSRTAAGGSRAKPASLPGTRESAESPPAASMPSAPGPGAELDLTPEERARLERLRGRPAAEREGRPWHAGQDEAARPEAARPDQPPGTNPEK